MVAFHFPPLVGSSGIQRTLRFAQYLPDFGWRPVILVPSTNAYEDRDLSTLDQIPPGCDVVRVPSLDTGRHLSIAGRYPGFLAMPDRWASWAWLAPAMGANACRRFGAKALWSTYPIATAHRIGASIARRTGLPWIADFRDPMLQDGYPEDAARRRAFNRLEDEIADVSARMVFVTPSALRTYRSRYPTLDETHFVLIENGYDESVFASIGAISPPARQGRPLVLVHSGIVYPSERDPTALFVALGRLKNAGSIRPGQFLLRFRAPVHGDLLRALANRNDVAEFVEVSPPIPYREAVAEMLTSDGLVVMQANNCNEQIPAKVYEYVRAGRPILGLADPAGDTGHFLIRQARGPVAALESAEGIESAFSAFLEQLSLSPDAANSIQTSREFSRRDLTRCLASTLDELVTATTSR